MNDVKTHRPIPLVLTTLIAVFSALVALMLSGGHAAHAHGLAAHHTDTHTISRSEFALRTDMRKLWEDHVTWTRLAVISLTTGSPDTKATVGRLLQNQTDIGDAIKPFYGSAAGNRLTALLHDHITIAVELLQDARAGDQAAFDAAKTRWYANANDIADFLSAANPRFWPRATMRAAMKTHLDQTLAEAVAELGADYPASVADYEAIHLHILDMADLLSSGIMRQFPRRS